MAKSTAKSATKNSTCFAEKLSILPLLPDRFGPLPCQPVVNGEQGRKQYNEEQDLFQRFVPHVADPLVFKYALLGLQRF